MIWWPFWISLFQIAIVGCSRGQIRTNFPLLASHSSYVKLPQISADDLGGRGCWGSVWCILPILLHFCTLSSMSVQNYSSLFRPESIFLEKEETSFFRALSLIPCNTEHKEVKVINLMKTCPSTKELQQSFEKLRELCVLETSKDFWSLDDQWLSSVETSRYCLNLKLFTQKDLMKAPDWLIVVTLK